MRFVSSVHSYSAHAVYYRGLTATSDAVSCADYGTFILTLDRELSGFTTPAGDAYTLVNAGDALTTVSLSVSFSLYLTTPIVTTNIATIEANLAVKWEATFGG